MEETQTKPKKDNLPDWLPKRIVNFARRIGGLVPGKYVITLTIRDDAAFYTCTPMNEVEH